MYLHLMDTEQIIEDVGDRCLALRALSTARAITRRYDAALRPSGLTITQFTLLISIARLKPVAISALADVLSMERTSLSRNLKPLEAAGLVERMTETSGRAKPIRITDAGRKKLEEAYPMWIKAQQATEEKLTDSAQSVSDMLYTLRGEGPRY